jgi:F-type H+-transporting ATPase subunit gamma
MRCENVQPLLGAANEQGPRYRTCRPVDRECGPPSKTLPPQILLERLAAEYVFAQLCQAAMHTFEAEIEARMLAMASAKTNIGSKLSRLSQRERHLRQEEITSEIIELAAGAEALSVERRGRSGRQRR